MILATLLILLLSGAIVASLSAWVHKKMPFYIALGVLTAAFVMLLGSWNYSSSSFLQKGNWMYEVSINWIPAIGASLHLAMDGLSYIMILLTLLLGIVAVLASQKVEQQGFYFFNTLLMIAGVIGIFLAMDLFLFFFCWEMMLLPLYLLIAAYGDENRGKVAYKFLLYTQLSGLMMLLSILGLYFIHASQTGIYSFDLTELQNTVLSFKTAMILISGFLIAFFVKLPVFPFHGWLPKTFTQAPATAILTGLLIKTGAYGIIRFAIPLFPEAQAFMAPLALTLGLITIFYGAFIAFSQTDLRLIAAYSGISHMGFIIIGLFAFNQTAYQGVVIQMIASAVSTSALVLVANVLYKKTGTYDISRLGGLWEKVPVLSGLGLFFAMASLGMPGLANFMAEFLILSGTFKVSVLVSVLASLGVIFAAAYSLRIIQKVFVGAKQSDEPLKDICWKNKLIFGIMVIVLLWIGLKPQPIIDRVKPAIEKALVVPDQPEYGPLKKNPNESFVTIK